MKFIIKDIEHSYHDIEKLIGYKPINIEHGETFGYCRALNKGEYPRFHLLISMKNGGEFGHQFDLCLENSSDKNDRDYRGLIVKEEMNRIKKLLMKN